PRWKLEHARVRSTTEGAGAGCTRCTLRIGRPRGFYPGMRRTRAGRGPGCVAGQLTSSADVSRLTHALHVSRLCLSRMLPVSASLTLLTPRADCKEFVREFSDFFSTNQPEI